MKKIFLSILSLLPAVAITQLPEKSDHSAFIMHYSYLSCSFDVDAHGDIIVGNRASKIEHILNMRDDRQELRNAVNLSTDERRANLSLCSYEYLGFRAALTDDEIEARILFLTQEINSCTFGWEVSQEELA
jgi:hypothetical protein